MDTAQARPNTTSTSATPVPLTGGRSTPRGGFSAHQIDLYFIIVRGKNNHLLPIRRICLADGRGTDRAA
jgi:hypothetical protein